MDVAARRREDRGAAGCDRCLTSPAPPPADGYYYHSIDLPGWGSVAGAWDLRGNVDGYLGGVDVAGRRVLEIGAANGFLTFQLEGRGAEVVPVDLSPERLGDIMNVPGLDLGAFEAGYRRVVAGMNRAWAHARAAQGSSLALVHASAYDDVSSLGPFDVAIFGCVLLHLRDPYTALHRVAGATRGRIVVTELYDPPFRGERSLSDRLVRFFRPLPASVARESGLVFNPTHNSDPCTWWTFSPGAIQCLLEAVGFSRIRVTYHEQLFRYRYEPWGPARPEECPVPTETARLFTVVAERP